MSSRPALFLLGTLLTGGACQDSAVLQGNDLASAPADLAAARQRITIRELNGSKVPTGTPVTFSGVIIGPLTFTELGADKKSCNYNVFVAQPDANPTLQDGIEVSFNKAEASTSDMGLKVANCKTYGMTEAITKLMTGHAVDVNGTFTVTASGDREVDISANTDIIDQGDAPVKPVPVIMDPKDLINGNKMAFQAASGALVQFQNIVVSDINKYQDFMASADGMTNKATIASNFMTAQDSAYKAPAVGTKLKSITGIVFTDFGGTVWARTMDDFVP